MSNNKIHFSIILTTLNRAKSLSVALDSIAKLDFDKEKFEIIVIDNGSIDNTKDAVNKFIEKNPSLNVRYIYEPEPGLLSGRHKGAFEARGDILSYIDDDVSVDKNWLSGISEAFEDEKVELVGGKNLPIFEVEPPEWISWFWIKHPYGKWMAELSLLDFGDSIRTIDPLFVFGLNFSIRKKTFFSLRGFHPDCIDPKLQFFQGDGETGLTRKAKEQNCKAIYQPRATVYHIIPKERLTEEYFCKRYFYQGVSNSYTEFRRVNKPTLAKKIEVDGPFIKLRRILSKIKRTLLKKNEGLKKTGVNEELLRLKEKFEKSRLEGFNYHRNAILTNPKLKDWVLQEDYLEYKLPNI